MPQECLILQIAGIKFRISGKYPLLIEPVQASYSPFFFTGTTDSTHTVFDVQILAGTCSDLRELGEKVFEAEETWGLYKKGDQRSIFYDPAGSYPESGWIARISPDFSRATVFVGKDRVIKRESGSFLLNPVRYPLDQLLLMYALAHRKGLIVHACSCVFSCSAIVMPGISGAGKSTLSRLLRGIGKDDILSDDRVVLRMMNEMLMVCGTPWAGDADGFLNRILPVSNILILKQGDRNKVKKLDVQSAAERLLPMLSMPWYEPDMLEDMLGFCSLIPEMTPVYEFEFKPEEAAAQMIMDLAERTPDVHFKIKERM